MPTNITFARPSTLSAFFIVLVLLSSGCVTTLDRVVLTKPAPEPENEQSQTSVPKEDVPPNDPDLKAFFDKVNALVEHRDFQKLEDLAITLSKSKERFKGGGWKIYSFDSLVAAPATDGPDAWESHIALLQEWVEKFPDSIFARTALANAYIDYAWQARGEGYANSVSEENWAKFNERIKKAVSIAQDGSRLKVRYTGYFQLLLLLAKVQGWDRDSYDAVFNEAIALEPTYQYFYTEKAVNLLPRWNGQPGEWEAFADRVKKELGEKEGIEMYYLMVAEISGYYGGDFFDQNRVSWKETKKGFELYEKEFGMSRHKLNEFALLTVYASDPQAACSIFSRLQGPNDFEPGVWRDRLMFESFRAVGIQFCKTPHINNAKPRA